MQPPSWFVQALAKKAEARSLECAGARIAYRHWTRGITTDNRKSLVLVHGHAAHSRWWDCIAPLLPTEYDVVAVDLSGCGDSDHRALYSPELFAEEILACVQQAELNNPILVGHSFGGAMSRVAAYLHPSVFYGLILVDSALSPKQGSRQTPAMPRLKDHVYASREIAMRRFRLRPPQPCENFYILEHIAYHSVKRSEDGYRFKLDPAIFAKMPQTRDFPASADMFRDMTIEKGVIYGELSRFYQPESLEVLTGCLNADRIKKIPNAHHHVFLDQPLEFAKSLNDLLQQFG
ncbi:MAG: alpha/beta hydrolase [Pseudomonadota bacterium]